MYIRNFIRLARIFALKSVMTVSAVMLSAPIPVRADDFYKGKSITLIIASNTSGGYDTYGRILARHLGAHLAGNPTIVPQNMPGAGGIRAANYLYSIAAKDGTVFGIFDQAMFLDQLLGIPGLRGDVRQFNWIGRLASNSSVLFAWHTAAVKKIEDAFTHELIVAAPGSNSRLNWTALNALTGTKLKLLTGYEGPATAKVAMERGEVEALSLPWSVLREENPEWLADKKINLLLQTGLEKNADLPDLPRMIDLAKNDNDRRVLEIFASPSLVGRSFAAPPGVPKERVDELRTAFVEMTKDPDFLAEIAKLKFDLDPLSGQDLQAFFTKADYPPELVEQAKAIARLAEH
ncbi:MAG TPA: tripartite tricarboxylate transporter substrate-binding protein [Xanthobacteraceae bacterium]|nr:tripartite tricarboxylate transporter substrate-binding protein [Xanthobacteraceae bacterium]